MSLSAREFDAWLAEAGLPTSSADVARHTGRRLSTITTQRFRSRITEDVVVQLSRAFNLDPLRALAYFEPYQGLDANPRPPSTDELVSQLTHNDLLVELLSRNKADLARVLGASYLISPIPHPDGVRKWIDAIDPGNIRSEMSTRSGIATTNLSALLTDNKLSPELSILAATIADVSPLGGLVVSGLLMPEEAGWPPQGRENALRNLEDLVLLDLLDQRLKSLRRRLKKKIESQDTANALWETLG
ncbi:hypothetical protein [Arthrobacter sp. B1805]|uniref:hypothetical protein n=1 Tax=Arthrobacter sp. B1805 TaxID=2058892 RepID=UPI000CE506A2|nr:hypothetical protein [Arthrobacter sp. B1805]